MPGRRDEQDETKERPPPDFTSGDSFATIFKSLSGSIGILSRDREAIHAYLSPDALFAQWPQDTPHIELSGSESLFAARAHGNRAIVVCASPDLQMSIAVDELAAVVPPARENIAARFGSIPGAAWGTMTAVDAGGPGVDAYGCVFQVLESYPEVAGGRLSIEGTASESVSMPPSRKKRGLFGITIEKKAVTPPPGRKLTLGVKFKPEVPVVEARLILEEMKQRVKGILGTGFDGEIVVYRDDTLPDSRH